MTEQSSDRSEWKRIPAKEWTKRLSAAQALALSFIARHGLDYEKCEESLAGLILEEYSAAARLLPALQDAQQTVDASLKNLYQSYTQDYPGVSGEPLSSEVFTLSMAAVEAGFLFGVIVGSNLSPAIVAAMPAPSAPPVVKKQRAGTKGGAR